MHTTSNNPVMDADARIKLAIAACEGQFSATLTAFAVALTACEEKVNDLDDLCNEALAEQDTNLTEATDVCESTRATLLMKRRTAQRSETRATAGTAQREYNAAFAAAKKNLAAAYFPHAAATGSILATLAELQAIKTGLNEIFTLLAPTTT